MRTFPPESRAERSFSKSFSPRESCPERLLAHVTSRNLRKNGYAGGPERQFAHVTSRNMRELAHSATIARREAGEKVALRTRFHQKQAPREAGEKIISTQVSASPGRAKKEPSHTFLTSHHPARPAPPRTTPPHHRPIPPHPTHTTPPHPTPHTTHHVLAHRPPMAIVTGTHRHHDGDPSPS